MLHRMRRLLRVLAMAIGLYVIALISTQFAMELRYPMALKIGPLTAVLFLDSNWPHRPEPPSGD